MKKLLNKLFRFLNDTEIRRFRNPMASEDVIEIRLSDWKIVTMENSEIEMLRICLNKIKELTQ